MTNTPLKRLLFVISVFYILMALYLFLDPEVVFLSRFISAVDPGELVILFLFSCFLIGIPVLIICGFASLIMHDQKQLGLLSLASVALITLAMIRMFYIDIC